MSNAPGRRAAGRRARVAVAAVVGATLLLAACGGGSGGTGSGTGTERGVTATSIELGTHMPLTGVAAPGYSDIPRGAKAYFDHLNRQGGINGRTVEYTVEDDGYDPARTTSVTDSLVRQDEVFGMLQGLGTPTHRAVLDLLDEQHVPDLFVSSGALAWNQPSRYPQTFGWQPDYTVEGKVLGKYVKDNFPTAKVGLFLQDDDLGRDGAAGVEQFVAGQVVRTVTYTPGDTDVAAQVQQLKAAGADLVVAFDLPAYTALSQLQARRQGLRARWFYSGVGLDARLVGGLLASLSGGRVSGARALDGLYTTSFLDGTTDTASPWVQLWQRIWQAEGDGTPLTDAEIYGMAGAYTFAQTLAAAGRDVTRASVVKALEDRGSSFKGPALAPFAYSQDSHRGISGLKVVRLEGGRPGDVTRVQVTGDGDTPITEYTEPQSPPPADGVPTG